MIVPSIRRALARMLDVSLVVSCESRGQYALQGCSHVTAAVCIASQPLGVQSWDSKDCPIRLCCAVLC